MLSLLSKTNQLTEMDNVKETTKSDCINAVLDYIRKNNNGSITRHTIKNLIRGRVIRNSTAKYKESSLNNMADTIIKELKDRGILFPEKSGVYYAK